VPIPEPSWELICLWWIPSQKYITVDVRHVREGFRNRTKLCIRVTFKRSRRNIDRAVERESQCQELRHRRPKYAIKTRKMLRNTTARRRECTTELTANWHQAERCRRIKPEWLQRLHNQRKTWTGHRPKLCCWEIDVDVIKECVQRLAVAQSPIRINYSRFLRSSKWDFSVCKADTTTKSTARKQLSMHECPMMPASAWVNRLPPQT
jgi:hypothetical protein